MEEIRGRTDLRSKKPKTQHALQSISVPAAAPQSWGGGGVVLVEKGGKKGGEKGKKEKFEIESREDTALSPTDANHKASPGVFCSTQRCRQSFAICCFNQNAGLGWGGGWSMRSAFPTPPRCGSGRAGCTLAASSLLSPATGKPARNTWVGNAQAAGGGMLQLLRPPAWHGGGVCAVRNPADGSQIPARPLP